jgi:hypothetical protein
VDELRQRLDRLPAGHPSSPYNDDGTRKPPVAQLKQLELPLSDERPADAGAKRSLGAPLAAPTLARGNVDDPGHGADHATDDRPGAAADSASDAADRASGPADRASAIADSSAAAADSAIAAAARSAVAADRLGADNHGRHDSNRQPDGDIGFDRNGRSDSYLGATLAGPEAQEPRASAEGLRGPRSRNLTPEHRQIADQALTRYRVAEGRNVFGSYGEAGLTPAMRRVESQLEHGQLAPDTESNALKPADSFKEKYAKLISRFPDSEPASLAAEVHDGIRYTFVFGDSHYVDTVAQASNSLEQAGYELVELQPSWDSGEYKGVNSRWRDQAGLSFEVQWHTPQSWEARQKTHAAVERICDPSTPLEEVEQLRAYQRAVTADVPVPPGAMLMRPYKKES